MFDPEVVGQNGNRWLIGLMLRWIEETSKPRPLVRQEKLRHKGPADVNRRHLYNYLAAVEVEARRRIASLSRLATRQGECEHGDPDPNARRCKDRVKAVCSNVMP